MHQSGSVYRRSHLLGAASLTKTHATKDPIISEVVQAETTLDKIGISVIHSTLIFTSAVCDGGCFTAPPAGLAYALHPVQGFDADKCVDCGVYCSIWSKKKRTLPDRRYTLLCVFGSVHSLARCSLDYSLRCCSINGVKARHSWPLLLLSSSSPSHSCRHTDSSTFPLFSSSFAQRGDKLCSRRG